MKALLPYDFKEEEEKNTMRMLEFMKET